MRFNLLGSVEIITDDERSFLVSPSKTGQVLTLLLARSPKMASVDTLIQELWDERPPRSALTTLQTYIYHARQLFARERMVPAGRQLLVTHPSGYAIEADPDEVDAHRFERLVSAGREAFRSGDPATAAAQLAEALQLWRGPVFGGMPTGSVLATHANYLSELHLNAIELRVEAEAALGRHRELIPELRSLIATYPLNENFHAQLIRSLQLSGRRAEALKAYQSLRRILRDELGIEPTPEMQDLQRQVLV